MARREEWDDDDGRVIADMSGVERPRLFVPRRGRESDAPAAAPRERGQDGEDRPWENGQQLTPQERRMYLFGALAFIAGLGAAVWLMLWMWT